MQCSNMLIFLEDAVLPIHHKEPLKNHEKSGEYPGLRTSVWCDIVTCVEGDVKQKRNCESRARFPTLYMTWRPDSDKVSLRSDIKPL